MKQNQFTQQANYNMKYLVPAGRLLFSFIFILSAPGHFKPENIAFAASQGVPLASVSVPLSGIIELIGGLSILLGYKARYGAWLLVLFLVPVTLMLHQFWNIPDPMARQMDMISFFKNLSILGGALLITWFGSGALSIDAWLSRRGKPQVRNARIAAGM